MLNGIKNFLEFLNANWTVLAVLLGLIVGLIQRVKVLSEKLMKRRFELQKGKLRKSC